MKKEGAQSGPFSFVLRPHWIDRLPVSQPLVESGKNLHRISDDGLSMAKHVRGVLEIGRSHDEVVPNSQGVCFQSARRTPRTGAAPALPVEDNDSIRFSVPSTIFQAKSLIPQREGAVFVEDEARIPRVPA